MVITENNIQLITVTVVETLKQLSEKRVISTLGDKNESKELLTIKEVMELYPNLSEKTIRNAINNMGLKYIPSGRNGNFLIDRKDLEDFLDKQKQVQVPINRTCNNSKSINIASIINKNNKGVKTDERFKICP